MQIGDVTVKTHEKGRYVPISNHPYYTSLNEWNPRIYGEYIRKSAYQSSKPSGSWEGFVALTWNLHRTGLALSENDNIQVTKTKEGWKCRHGKHRMCIIMFLYGPSARLQVKNGIVVGITTPPTYNPMLHACTLIDLFKKMVFTRN